MGPQVRVAVDTDGGSGDQPLPSRGRIVSRHIPTGAPANWQSCLRRPRQTHGPRTVSNLRISTWRPHRRRRQPKKVPAPTWNGASRNWRDV